jgi:catechol 2,3-dioxygenase-like lactoylglutathione lyase family enzyme
MGVTFHSLRPMLRTKDLHATVQFWTDRLGFSCDGLSEEDGWASLFHDGVGLMIATPNAHVPFDTPGFTGSFYFNVDDVAALWADLKDRVEIAYPMEEFHYGIVSSRSTTTTDTSCSSGLRCSREEAPRLNADAGLLKDKYQKRNFGTHASRL